MRSHLLRSILVVLILFFNKHNEDFECKNADYCKFAKKIISQGCPLYLKENEEIAVVQVFIEFKLITNNFQ